MAETMTREQLRRQIFDDNVFYEVVNEGILAPYQGKDANAIVQVKDGFKDVKGDKVTFIFVPRLKGDGVEGNQVLWGNEEALDERSMILKLKHRRNAVRWTEWDDDRDVIDLMEASKETVKSWILEATNYEFIDSLSAVTMVDGRPITFAKASTAQKNAWLTNNADRALFGANNSNLVAGNINASLATVDDTNDLFGPTMLGKAKNLAKATLTSKTARRIRPTRVLNTKAKGVQLMYVFFAPTPMFSQFYANAEVKDALKLGLNRGEDNPLFTPGDLLWNNVLIRELPELPIIKGAGTAGIDVCAGYLCGAQALGAAWARRPYSIFQQGDYGENPDGSGKKFRMGVGQAYKGAFGKLMFGTGADDNDNYVDNGIVTVYGPATKDA